MDRTLAPSLLERALAADVLDAALAHGADFAELFVERRNTRHLTFLDSRVKDASSGQSLGIGIRLLHGTEARYAHTNDLGRENLLLLADTLGRARPGTGRLTVPALERTPANMAHPAGEDPRGIEPRRKVELLERVDRAARAASGLISQVEASVLENLQDVLVINSEGLWAEDHRPYLRLTINAIATDGAEAQTGQESPGALAGWEWFQTLELERLADQAARMAVTMLRAGYAPSGKMPVIIDRGFGGVILHEACGHLLETTSVATGNSVLADKLGQLVANPAVTVVDDGTLMGEWGSLALDDEGLPTERTVLIQDGVLESYLVDRLGARKTGYRPTGSGRRESYRFAPTSRMRNTFIAPGPHRFEDLIASVPYGIYAKRMGGGSVSPGTGEFNFSVREAYMIRDGQIAEPVRGATLIGNGADVLHRIDQVGRELELAAGMCGSSSGLVPVNVGQPPIRVSEIVVGGRN